MRVFEQESFPAAVGKIIERYQVALYGQGNEYALFGRTESSSRILYLPVRINEKARSSFFINQSTFLSDADFSRVGECGDCSLGEEIAAERERLRVFLLENSEPYRVTKKIETGAYLFLFGAVASEEFASEIGGEVPCAASHLGMFWRMDLMRPFDWYFKQLLEIPESWIEDSYKMGSNPLPALRKKFPSFRWEFNPKEDMELGFRVSFPVKNGDVVVFG